MDRWKDLMQKLVGKNSGEGEYPLLKGLRVVEVHPGNNFHGLSHGLHFHCLFNQRICVHRVRRIAKKFGFGRIHARKVSQAEAAYLGKYLTKKQPELSKGARRWGTINWTNACKVRDVQIESTFHRNIKRVQSAVKQDQLSPDVIHSIFVNTRLHGEFNEWPTEKYYYSNRSQEWLNEDRLNGHRSEWATHPPKMLLRSNKQTREQSMVKQALIWKEKARRRSIGFEACVIEDQQKRAWQARVESETKPSGKIFYIKSRGFPGSVPGGMADASPVAT